VAWSILQKVGNHPNDPKKRGVESLLEHGIYQAAYPLHEGNCDSDDEVPEDKAVGFVNPRRLLTVNWARWGKTFRLQPLDDVTKYFGEKIGFYFAFMDFYVKMLIPPSIFGLINLIIGNY